MLTLQVQLLAAMALAASEVLTPLQVLAFFQRELALHAHHHLDDAVASFSLDREIHPIFKVATHLCWGHPPPFTRRCKVWSGWARTSVESLCFPFMVLFSTV